ncbi:MAG: metal-dependent hydrolase [Pseudomonadales bacterium]|jgi:inner membrane protein|nr:metal-dependent hydrolase [Pseudomonadales bacterium]
MIPALPESRGDPLDSVTQMALGAAVGHAVLGRRIGASAALYGAVLGTLPDLDVLVPHADPVSTFTWHRSWSHSLLVLTLVAPALAVGLQRLHGRWTARAASGPPPRFGAWWALVFGALVTHPLLDAFTIYGTQLLWPLDPWPFGLGSIFIIDPIYTLPLAGGLVATLVLARCSIRWAALPNALGLVLSTVYLGWSVLAQGWMEAHARHALQEKDIAVDQLLATPAPFNTLLWRVLAIQPDGSYVEGFDSLVDGSDRLTVTRFPSDRSLLEGIRDHGPMRRLAWFTKGYYAVRREGDDVVMTDLRMGVEPSYVFSFRVGTVANPHARPAPTRQLRTEFDLGRLGDLWDRIWDADADVSRR